MGTHNEPRIAAHSSQFIKDHSAFQVEQIKSYGLLCARNMPFAAFSPDEIAAIVSKGRGNFHGVLEYKTRVASQTEQHEVTLAGRFGVFASVELTTNGFSSNFKALVPDGSHRSQILHSIVCGGLTDGFLVYASPTRIIRVVHVFVGGEVASTYRQALTVICGAYMQWVYDESLDMPFFSLEELGHCIDTSTLSTNLALWRSLVKIIEARGHPLPPAMHIIPSLVSLWNRIKCGINLYSRFLKNVHSRHAGLPSMAAIWLRIIQTLIYNAHQSHQLFKAQSYLMDTVRCASFTAFQNYKQNLPSFAAFCRDAARALRSSRQPRPVLAPVVSDWIRHRLSKEVKHHSVQIENKAQQCCVLCCQISHGSENVDHTRRGFKTRFQCNQCLVPLCTSARWNGEQSCFERFHADRELPNPCQVSEQLRSTRQNVNRAQPPSRKRQRLSLDIPNRRAGSTRLQVQERRRSLRLRNAS